MLPIVGMMDGLVIPIMVLPDSLFSFDKNGLMIYQAGAYAIIIVLLLLFYKYGKEWRENFELEMRHRYVQKWEQVLLWIVGCMMMVFSVFMSRDIESISHAFGTAVAKDIAASMIAEGLMSFVLTVTTIILIMQGNKRSYYNGIAECRRESGERLTIQMVKALANTIDAKDSYTNGHSTRVADAYDAMTSKRSYRDVLAQDIVREEIIKGKGTQFDPEIAEVMLELMDEDMEYRMHE